MKLAALAVMIIVGCATITQTKYNTHANSRRALMEAELNEEEISLIMNKT